jgi:hypothetical protein
MDLDAKVNALWKSKAMVEEALKRLDNVPQLSESDIRRLMSFIPQFEEAIADTRRAVLNVEALAGDIEMIRRDLAPVIEWMQAKKKAESDAADAAAAAAAAEAAKTKEEPKGPPQQEAPKEQPKSLADAIT